MRTRNCIPQGRDNSIVCVSQQRWRMIATLMSALYGVFLTASCFAQSDAIKNPYFKEREWKVWSIDDLEDAPAELLFTKPADRRFPSDEAKLTLVEQPGLAAGFWDDVYVSQDNFHSRIRPEWKDRSERRVSIRNQFPHLKRPYFSFELRGTQVLSPASAELKQLGATYVSQSTSGMGHDLADHPLRVLIHEREFYFSGVLRATPAHTSFRELLKGQTEDSFKALVPSIFNSLGSSGSETWALTKMCIAGGCLRGELKRELKRHGLLPSTLLYVWKAALPYAVPFESELRHRVAYLADGNDTDGRGRLQATTHLRTHQYDDSAHLRNMVSIASKLKLAPPVAVSGDVHVEGGKLIYALRTAALIEQDQADVTVTLSMQDSFDLLGIPVSIQPVCICGNMKTRIDTLSENRFKITVPFDPALPRGRTTVLFVPSNGQTKGNPVAINVYRKQGQPNRRPVFTAPGRVLVAPGQTARIPLIAEDPEGFSVSFAKADDSFGDLDGDELVWSCPADQSTGVYPAVILASDRSSGSSYQVLELPIHVQSVVANIRSKEERGSVDLSEQNGLIQGVAPLQVQLSSEGSRDFAGGKVTSKWQVNSSKAILGPSFEQTFGSPGVYRVRLEVTGNSGKDSVERTIHIQHNWPERFSNGWTNRRVSEFWSWNPEQMQVGVAGFQGQTVLQTAVKERKLESRELRLRKHFRGPFCLEVDFIRSRNMRNSGLDIYGVQLGRGQLKAGGFSEDFSLVAEDSGGRQTVERICEFPAKLVTPARLRVYVEPTEANRFRISGSISYADETHWFLDDDCKKKHPRIAVLSGELGTQFFTRVKAWSPVPPENL